MKQLLYISVVFILLMINSIGCSFNKEDHSKIIDSHSCSITIEGMMCEKGCKSTIESKLSEMNGVINAKVDYETTKAFITYNHNEITSTDIINEVGEIANGIYSAQLIQDAQVDLAPEHNDSNASNESKSVRSFSFELPDITRLIPRLF
jgi:copper chaperone CopZ